MLQFLPKTFEEFEKLVTGKSTSTVPPEDLVEHFNSTIFPQFDSEVGTSKEKVKQVNKALEPDLTPRYIQQTPAEPDPSLGTRARRGSLPNPLLAKMDEGVSPTTDDLNNDVSRLVDSMRDPNQPKDQILNQFKNVLKNRLAFTNRLDAPAPRPAPRVSYVPKPRGM